MGLRAEGLNRLMLRDLSFEIGGGERVALMGRSGEGKTLLLRALADLDPNEGRVWIDNAERSSMDGPAWRRRVGYVPNDSGWWSRRVGDHFQSETGAVALVEQLGLSPDVLRWDTERLSSGERQRLALARAAERKPRALLLDEPTANLDAETTELVERLLTKLTEQGALVLFTTHDQRQADRLACRSLRLAGGALTEQAARVEAPS